MTFSDSLLIMDINSVVSEISRPKGQNGSPATTKRTSKSSKKKTPTKRATVYFEVEILDAKTREKLCFLDKVRGHGVIESFDK